MQDTCPEKVSTDQLSFLLYIDQQAKKKEIPQNKTCSTGFHIHRGNIRERIAILYYV